MWHYYRQRSVSVGPAASVRRCFSRWSPVSKLLVSATCCAPAQSETPKNPTYLEWNVFLFVCVIVFVPFCWQMQARCPFIFRHAHSDCCHWHVFLLDKLSDEIRPSESEGRIASGLPALAVCLQKYNKLSQEWNTDFVLQNGIAHLHIRSFGSHVFPNFSVESLGALQVACFVLFFEQNGICLEIMSRN